MTRTYRGGARASKTQAPRGPKPDVHGMDHRQKAKDLIELSADEGTSPDERVAAASRACALIRKYDLLSNPLDLLGKNETVRAVKAVAEVLSSSDLKENVGTIKRGIEGLFGGRRR